MEKVLVALLVLMSFSESAFAWPPTIGPELAFQNKATKDAWESRYQEGASSSWQVPTATGELAQAKLFRDEIMKSCEGCTLKVSAGKFGLEQSRIEFQNGFWLNISVDPGIVELQTAPLEEARYQELMPFIEETVYGAAKRLEMTHVPDDGHLNFGAKATFETAENLAEFMLDQINHPELGLGVLGQDIENGPPLAIQELDQLGKFFAIMDDVKSGKITDLVQLANRINNEVYYRSVDDLSPSGGRHYQGVSIKRLNQTALATKGDQPLEIRWAAGQPNFRRVLLIYKLYTKRIEFLRSRPGFANLQRRLFAKPAEMTAPEKLTRFHLFVTEMGGDFEEYKELIDSPRIAKAALDPIVTGKFDWSKRDAYTRLTRYLPDVETSELVRQRFEAILADEATPAAIKDRLRDDFVKQMTRVDIGWANLEVMDEYQKKVLPTDRWVTLPAAGSQCQKMREAFGHAQPQPQ